MQVEGLRSPYEKVGGLVYFGRMLDKIRLFAKDELPSEYQGLLGEESAISFDGRCCRFLRISYTALVDQVLKNDSDALIFEWACAQGRRPTESETEIWNSFMQKRGWRDRSASLLKKRAEEAGMPAEFVLTHFDFIDLDEERPLRYDSDPPPPKELPKGTSLVPGLRSPYEKLGGIVHFGRMLDKVRLFHQGKLPDGWVASRGGATNFDGQCSKFLGVAYAILEAETLRGRSDEEMVEWVIAHGGSRSEEEIEIWNDYLSKYCWRDQFTSRLHTRLLGEGMPINSVLIMFDFIDLDEGRTLGISTRTP
jgi:hypothetical protein